LRVWPARLLLPALFLLLSLSFNFTHLQPDRLLAEMEYSQDSNLLLVKTRSHTPSLENLFPSGVVFGHQNTSLPTLSELCATTTEGASVAEGLPQEANAIGDSRKKRQRQKHTPHWQHLTRAQVQPVDSRQNLDTNQSN